MTTIVYSNGSKMAGQAPDSIGELLEVLKREPLDRYLFDGHFITPHGNTVRFFGNFLTVSHVFNIDTDDPDVIQPLTRAIRRNQRTPAYLAQPYSKERRANERRSNRCLP